MTKKVALFLYNMGGPATTNDVPTFLGELFRDNDLLGIPGPEVLQRTVAGRIVSKRSQDVMKKYDEIGGGSPQLAITSELAAQVENLLRGSPSLDSAAEFVVVAPLMRYAPPRAETCIEDALRAGAQEIWLLSQYPHCARATTGSSLREFALTFFAHPKHRSLKVRNFASYAEDHAFQELWARRLEASWNLLNPDNRHLIVSAHNLPVSYISAGDPYRDQIYRSARATLRRIGLCEGRDWTLAWQSAVGPSKWMSPDTRDVIRGLASRRGRPPGAQNPPELLIWPIAFVSDHIETLHEIDIEFAEIAHAAGISKFLRVPNLNASPDFAEHLATKIVSAARDLEKHGSSLALRDMAEQPSGEGCHWQPGGCLCGRYFASGQRGLTRGTIPTRVPASLPKVLRSTP